MSSAPLRIGLAGLGTVGSGVVEILQQQGETLSARAGRPIVVTAIAVRDPSKPRPIKTDAAFVSTAQLVQRDDVDLIVEVIGGSDGVALDLARSALAAGKGFVTANKALIAHHGLELARLAEEHSAPFAFEAGVAGGIPILKTLREGLAANGFDRVYGILNGTCNYILTQMEETGASFESILEDAQKLGYAEADPTFDVDGIDAAHKLAILSSLAFGCEIDFEAVDIEGIRNVSALDIERASELGYRIKLLGVARKSETGIEQRVHPTMVPLNTPIAAVSDVYNAVVTEGDFVGRTVLEGKGAGSGPTASAVVADIIDVARGFNTPAFGVPVHMLVPFTAAPMEQHTGKYYLRLTVNDRAGVLADVSAVLRDNAISIESLIQRGLSSDEPVQIVLVTHTVEEADLNTALSQISALPDVLESPHMIRIESL